MNHLIFPMCVLQNDVKIFKYNHRISTTMCLDESDFRFI